MKSTIALSIMVFMWSFKRRTPTSKNIVASSSLSGERKKRSKGLRLFHAEAFVSSVEDAGSGYQSPSLIASGAQAQDVAVSTSITNLVFSFLLLKVLPVIHARTSTKRASLVIALCSALGWLPLIFILLLRPVPVNSQAITQTSGASVLMTTGLYPCFARFESHHPPQKIFCFAPLKDGQLLGTQIGYESASWVVHDHQW